MAFNNDLAYYEETWREDAEAREKAQNEWDELQDEDVIFDRVALAHCDGSGIAEEYYFDADQTKAIPCPGCPNCQLPEREDPPADTRPLPDWMEDPELVEFGVRRKPVQPEIPLIERRRIA